MKSIFVLVFLLYFFSFCFEKEDEGINETTYFTPLITRNKLDQMINEKHSFILCIYADFSTYYLDFQKGFDKIAQQYDQENKYKLLRFEYSPEDLDLISKFGIISLGNVVLFQDGEPTQTYKGSTKISDFSLWIQKIHLPSISQISLIEQLDEFKRNYPLVAFAKINDEDENLLIILEILSKKISNQKIIFVVQNTEEKSNLKFFRKLDQSTIEYSGNYEENKIQKFLTQNSLSFIQPLSRDNFDEYFSNQNKIGYLFINEQLENSNQHEKSDNLLYPTVQKILPLKNELYGKIWFSFINSGNIGGFASRYGIKSFPSLVVVDSPNQQFYKYDGKMDTQKILEWSQRLLKGKVPPTIKSEDLPNNDRKKVKKIVGYNWNKIVNDPKKNVFVNINTNWCVSCENSNKIFRQLANSINSNNLIFAQVDASKNQLGNSLEIITFPTFLLFTAENKIHPIQYSEVPQIELMIEFLQANLKNSQISIKIKSESELASESKSESDIEKVTNELKKEIETFTETETETDSDNEEGETKTESEIGRKQEIHKETTELKKEEEKEKEKEDKIETFTDTETETDSDNENEEIEMETKSQIEREKETTELEKEKEIEKGKEEIEIFTETETDTDSDNENEKIETFTETETEIDSGNENEEIEIETKSQIEGEKETTELEKEIEIEKGKEEIEIFTETETDTDSVTEDGEIEIETKSQIEREKETTELKKEEEKEIEKGKEDEIETFTDTETEIDSDNENEEIETFTETETETETDSKNEDEQIENIKNEETPIKTDEDYEITVFTDTDTDTDL
ncbi:protein disulfide isomerase [Anaeramoeba flamelloides]|uniref:Protein disulfide isomerase n=1 Tax=Anaeramoeba flamelloides TaxID=1746091 RepID=A0ABQ8Y3D1_9EUKA|nr:protein disulfide isomerase [Anaeramoeba flamelloides]